MDITVFQIIGAVLTYSSIVAFVRGEVRLSAEVGPSSGRSGGLHIDLTPEKYKYRSESVYSGKWVRPISLVVIAVGLTLMFIFKGDSIAFTI
mgnify:CR=1 FL=1